MMPAGELGKLDGLFDDPQKPNDKTYSWVNALDVHYNAPEGDGARQPPLGSIEFTTRPETRR
jgi:hypothetical protein